MTKDIKIWDHIAVQNTVLINDSIRPLIKVMTQ